MEPAGGTWKRKEHRSVDEISLTWHHDRQGHCGPYDLLLCYTVQCSKFKWSYHWVADVVCVWPHLGSGEGRGLTDQCGNGKGRCNGMQQGGRDGRCRQDASVLQNDRLAMLGLANVQEATPWIQAGEWLNYIKQLHFLQGVSWPRTIGLHWEKHPATYATQDQIALLFTYQAKNQTSWTRFV